MSVSSFFIFLIHPVNFMISFHLSIALDCKQRRPGTIFTKTASSVKPEVIDKEYASFVSGGLFRALTNICTKLFFSFLRDFMFSVSCSCKCSKFSTYNFVTKSNFCFDVFRPARKYDYRRKWAIQARK